MKTSIKIFSIVLISILTMSFIFINNLKTKDPIVKPTGTKQVFVMSNKKINGFNSKDLTKAFKHKKSDIADSTFELYNFDFENNTVIFTHMVEVNAKDDTLKLNLMKSDGKFAIYSFKDSIRYFNGIEDKLMVLNLNDDPNYPIIQILYKVKDKYHGLYSVDTRDLAEFLNHEETDIFKD